MTTITARLRLRAEATPGTAGVQPAARADPMRNPQALDDAGNPIGDLIFKLASPLRGVPRGRRALGWRGIACGATCGARPNRPFREGFPRPTIHDSRLASPWQLNQLAMTVKQNPG
jgi:hypothetical protein